jgi:hypothetical protein
VPQQLVETAHGLLPIVHIDQQGVVSLNSVYVYEPRVDHN